MEGPQVGHAFANLDEVASARTHRFLSPPYLTVVSVGRPFNAFSGTSFTVAMGVVVGMRATWRFSSVTRLTVTRILPSS